MTFLMATQNAKKLRELERILSPLGLSVNSPEAAGIDLGDVEENGATFEENARIKAMSAFEKSGMPSIADDSGLVVDVLGGAPGIYSARYAGENADDSQRIEKLLRELDGVPAEKRQARFVCAVCCVFPDGGELLIRETCEGVIAFTPQGSGGFGYDPVFLFGQKSFAQLTDGEKDEISHRGKALRALQAKLKERLDEWKR